MLWFLLITVIVIPLFVLVYQKVFVTGETIVNVNVVSTENVKTTSLTQPKVLFLEQPDANLNGVWTYTQQGYVKSNDTSFRIINDEATGQQYIGENNTYLLSSGGGDGGNTDNPTFTGTVTADAFKGTIITPDQPNITSLGSQSQDLSMGTFKITNMANPSVGQDAATKAYVDNYSQGMVWVNSVQTVTVVPLPNTPTYDNGSEGVGATLTAGSNGAIGSINGYSTWTEGVSRLLISEQADAKQNGIYVLTTEGDGATPYVLTRATDFDGSPDYEIQVGHSVLVTDGVGQGNRFTLATPKSTLTNPDTGVIVLGTDNLVWAQISLGGVSDLSWVRLTDYSSGLTGSEPTPVRVDFQTVTQSAHGNFSFDIGTSLLQVSESGNYNIVGSVMYRNLVSSNFRYILIRFIESPSTKLYESLQVLTRANTTNAFNYCMATINWTGFLDNTNTYFFATGSDLGTAISQASTGVGITITRISD